MRLTCCTSCRQSSRICIGIGNDCDIDLVETKWYTKFITNERYPKFTRAITHIQSNDRLKVVILVRRYGSRVSDPIQGTRFCSSIKVGCRHIRWHKHNKQMQLSWSSSGIPVTSFDLAKSKQSRAAKQDAKVKLRFENDNDYGCHEYTDCHEPRYISRRHILLGSSMCDKDRKSRETSRAIVSNIPEQFNKF